MSDNRAFEAGRWLTQARHDLDSARLLSDHGRHAAACFFAQQGAEKALKAYLYDRGAELVVGHSVARLCDEIARLTPELHERCREWATLDQYYIPTRYPDALPGGVPAEVYTATQATHALGLADDVVAEVERRLGG